MLVLVLFLLFTVLPLLELALLFKIGGAIGGANTLLLVVATGVVGAALARQQGTKTLRAIQAQMQRGQLPGAALFDGALILVAGALLVTPGVVTDVIGFSFLLPPWRALLRKGLSRWAQGRVQLVGQFPQPGEQAGPFPQPGEQAGPFPQAGPFNVPRREPRPQAFPFGGDAYGPESVRDVEAPQNGP